MVGGNKKVVGGDSISLMERAPIPPTMISSRAYRPLVIREDTTGKLFIPG